MAIFALVFFLGLIFANVMISVYAERKVSAFIQDRLGPMEVGKWGLLQLVADMLKLAQKEDIVPAKAERYYFLFAPLLLFCSIFMAFSLVPLNASMISSGSDTGVLMLFGVMSLDVLAILMAGWASANKYALMGAFRSVAQIISYELPFTLSVLSVLITCQSLSLHTISLAQGQSTYLFGIIKSVSLDGVDGFLAWNIFKSPILFLSFIVFFIAGLAQANRTPFDLPEADSELVAGYHTEYSGFRWAVVMLTEYGSMLLISFLSAILFFGGWYSPFPNIGFVKLANWTNGNPNGLSGWLWGAFWMLSKAYFFVFVMMWIRWSLPRLRIDQVMSLCWKYLMPAGFICLAISVLWRFFSI